MFDLKFDFKKTEGEHLLPFCSKCQRCWETPKFNARWAEFPFPFLLYHWGHLFMSEGKKKTHKTVCINFPFTQLNFHFLYSQFSNSSVWWRSQSKSLQPKNIGFVNPFVGGILIFSAISFFSNNFSYHYFKDILSEEQNKINSYTSYSLNIYYFLQPLEIQGSDIMEK